MNNSNSSAALSDLPALPPSGPAVPTANDRQRLFDRIKVELSRQELSGRALERQVGFPTGTLSKLKTGRVAVSLRALLYIAQALKVAPDTLVQGTAFTTLLLGVPESAESGELARLRSEVDAERAENAGLRAHIAALERQQASADASMRIVEAERDSLQSALERERESISKSRTTHKFVTERLERVERERDVDRQHLKALAASTEATTAKLCHFAQAMDGWRTRAIAQELRVRYLETELARAQAAAKQASGEQVGRILLASLASLGIGLAFAPSS